MKQETSFVIRKMQVSDIGQMRKIYAYYVRTSTATFDINEPTESFYSAQVTPLIQTGLALVSCIGSMVTGYCYARPWKEKDAFAATYESTLYIHPAYRGRQQGQRLLESLIAEARIRGVHTFVASITSPNPGSEALHLRLGFKKVSHYSQVGYKFGQWLDLAGYQLLLHPSTSNPFEL